METFELIMNITCSLAYCAVAFFAFYAYGRLKRQNDELPEMKALQLKILELLLGEHIRNSFNDLNNMKEKLLEMIHREDFEEAEKLKRHIAKAERVAMKELEDFKECFGDDLIDMTKMHV